MAKELQNVHIKRKGSIGFYGGLKFPLKLSFHYIRAVNQTKNRFNL